MVNLFYDADFFGGSVVPYVGAGLGGAFVDYKIVDPQSVVTFAGKDQTWAFAYQFMAGLTFPIDEGISMSIGYTYFQTEDFIYVNAFNENMNTNIKQQSVDVGLQFHL
jgi:opacity protein-like surface antigen